jgi:transposase InsO family protein
MDRLVHDMQRLQMEIDRVRRERDAANESARSATVEADRLRSFQQGTYVASGAYSNERRSKLKASDLPKFYGKDTEDVDDWIEKVSAITTYSGARDSELLKLLPLLLSGNASEWFTTLGETARAQLNTWELWKAALRNAFYLPDHEMRKRMMCRNRMLKKTETFGDYFQARRALQRYVYPEGTPDKILIQDIMEGIPVHLHPIIRANSIEVRTIDEFRRVLIDLEPGIRDTRLYIPTTGRTPYTPSAGRSPFTPKHNSVNNINQSVFKPSSRRDERSSSPRQKTGPTKLPPSPCRCGKMHWYVDCPDRKNRKSVNSIQKDTPATYPNNTTPGQGRPWRPWSQRTDDTAERTSAKDVNSIQTRSQRSSRPQAVESASGGSQGGRSTNVKEDQEICPTYARARIGSNDGQTHRVCIDTGSSISVIDYDYVRRHLPASKIQDTTSMRLLGVGSNMTSGTVGVDFHFVCEDESKTCIKHVLLHVVPRLNTKIILGNDYLVPLKAQVNLTTNLMKFGSEGVPIPLSSLQSKEERAEAITARTREAFIIEPRSQARIPIVLYPTMSAESYLIEASQPTDELFVARSIAKSNAKSHFVMLCNPGNNAVRVPAGTLVGYPQPMAYYGGPVRKINNINAVSSPQPGPDFEEEVSKLDVNPELTLEQRDAIKDVIRRQHHAFAYGDRKLGRTDLAIMKIETGDALPISQPPYHASPAGRKIIDDTIAELIAEDVIQESDSPWASPAILVHQKGKDRFCIDFRKVNEVTKADQYPIPRIDDILSQFAGKQYFSTFDANKGFHQIEIDPRDQEKTAFRTHRGLHQYKRMPFGLKSGPAIFQRLMDKVLGRYKWQIALVYIDDIIVYSKDFDTHVKDMETVLSLVAKSGITLSPTKCHLGYQSLTALGHTISNLGIGTADGTVKAVREFPQPTTKKELQRFLGLCVYYRRFVKDFSRIAKPLYNLLKDDVAYVWNEECQQALEELKLKLTTAPTLAHPDYSKPFLLYTDASGVGLGAVLAQHDDEGKEHPIIYLSRTLTPAEANYTITELECLAIVWSVRKLHAYLDGVKFTLITDHSALQWLFDFRGTNRRLVRWSMELQPYRDWMTIKYREGRVHTNADPLSRAPLPVCNSITTAKVPDDFAISIKEGYQHDVYFQKVREGLEQEPPLREFDRFMITPDQLIIYRDPSDEHSRICVPQDYADIKVRMDLIHDFHDSDIAGHLGMSRTTNALTLHYYWPGLSKDVKDYVRSCSVCQRNKVSNKSYGLHQPLDIPATRWHTITMDFAGPFPPSGEGHWDMVLIVVDKLTKRCHFIPSKNTDTASWTAKRFFDSVVRLHGLPVSIVSDRDAKFTSLFWSTLLERYGTKLRLSSAYHPQTDGQSERMVRTLKEMLRSAVNHKQDDWTEHLAALEFAYNNTVHPSTNMTPFELDLGYHPRGMHSFLSDTTPEVQATTEFIENLLAYQTRAHEHLEKARQAQAQQVNKDRPKPQSFNEGDLVMLSTKYIHPPFLRSNAGSRKLKAKYIGPFKVLKRVSATSYELDLPQNIKAHPVINLEYLKEYHETPERFSSRITPPPDPIEDVESGELEYEVETVKDHRTTKRRGLEFLVSWVGYNSESDTWEPESNLSGAKQAIEEYWNREKASKNRRDKRS